VKLKIILYKILCVCIRIFNSSFTEYIIKIQSIQAIIKKLNNLLKENYKATVSYFPFTVIAA